MAEANSIQVAKVQASPQSKLNTTEKSGVHRIMFGQIVSTSAAIGDTILFGKLPAGARICGVRLNNAAGTASSTLALGLRKSKDKTVLSATALAAATSIAAAASAEVSPTGAYLSAGQSYVTTEEDDVYGTIAGAATPVGGQLVTVIVDYVTN